MKKADKNGSSSRKDILGISDAFEARLFKERSELVAAIDALKMLGHRIVLTMGVWDLPHIGHCRYLREARSKGDILVVGVDSDALTRKTKGPNRPTVPEDERLEMLANIRWVDILALRSENEHPDLLVQQVKPDVWVTSNTTRMFRSDAKKRLGKYCGEIVTLDAQATISTTARISQLERTGVSQLGRDLVELLEKHGVATTSPPPIALSKKRRGK
ncbi:MAG: hypothetical protein A2571_01100 [Candidatus Vogelbacteria bacterium RIFOXYD1_FULL_44_32]|uniref:Cytidyltransferase-like domain-containing protein n=1 Tax=Candidatus Vogelbacteria bacterium RIFOXYD1_FULL_44_32 TaxID=1802438 RepID=A0A1G2QEE3_9BACT|nr:MAG: hypothetical protein A2571_01100 [Candidatus Vogelbacteria bacterium RIFOXYD1_FULL_44_32]